MLSALVALCMSSLGVPTDAPANLVVIYIDDLSSAWELPAVMTPNLHALAQRGVSFSRAYAGHSLCSPSRASLLAGQRTIHTQHFENMDDLPPSPVNGVPYLPCMLRESGYYTSGIGKLFHQPHPEYFDEYHDFANDPWIRTPLIDHSELTVGGKIYGGPYFNGPDGQLGKLADTKRTDQARVLLVQGKERLLETGQPFAIFLGLEATHEPYIYPEMYCDDYTESDVPPLPDQETTVDWKSEVSPAAYETVWFYDPDWGATEAEQRVQALLAYYRCISFVDQQVGRVLQALSFLGLASNTIVVLVSDHGVSFGEHAHLGKTTGYDEDIVAPLIIAVPSIPGTHGQQVSTPVAQVDLYPTLMELLGAPAPTGLDGTSLVGLLHHPSMPHPPVFYTTAEEWGFNLTRWVVERDAASGEVWKLGAWERDNDIPQVNQLYELVGDPGEYDNRYIDGDAAAPIDELEHELLDVGLLGPSTRSFGVGAAGLMGVPALTWSGVPALGAQGTLSLGNRCGAPTLGQLTIGFSGQPPGPKWNSVKTQLTLLVTIPAEGLELPLTLPSSAACDELPIGLQLEELDPAAICGIARSRALGLFLSD